MKSIIITISIVFLSLASFACDCEWGGDFFTMANQSELVVKVKVIRKMKDSNGFNIKMEVEVLEVFKGQTNQKTIIVWGDYGADCRPYIDYFEVDCMYYLTPTNFKNDFEQLNCGEMYLQLENNKVIGEKGVNEKFLQVGEMDLSEFESKLKNRIK